MHRTEHDSTGTRLLRPLAAAVLSAAWLFLLPAAHAQNQPLNQTQIRPQGQSSSSTISDQKLSAAAAAMGQVTTIRQSYEQRIAQAPSSDKERLTDEANDALQKAVTDQGLSGAMPLRPRSPPPERLRPVSLPYPGLSLRVPVERDHGFRWKMITQFGGT